MRNFRFGMCVKWTVEIPKTPVNGQFTAYPFKFDGARHEISTYMPQTDIKRSASKLSRSVRKLVTRSIPIGHGDTTAAGRRPADTTAAPCDRGEAGAHDRGSSRRRAFEGQPFSPLCPGLPRRVTGCFGDCGSSEANRERFGTRWVPGVSRTGIMLMEFQGVRGHQRAAPCEATARAVVSRRRDLPQDSGSTRTDVPDSCRVHSCTSHIRGLRHASKLLILKRSHIAAHDPQSLRRAPGRWPTGSRSAAAGQGGSAPPQRQATRSMRCLQ